ncbi:MAG TPA: TonB-dependent receptor [Steroidobacteraceae bacterium]|nr:TonB-dependent receptor [Steroidobacteraceae bacterium]
MQLGAGTNANYNSLQDPVTGVLLSGHAWDTGGGIATGPGALWGNTPCNNQTVIRKVWNPQVQQWTSNESETVRLVTGIKGRFGSDWRWDAYYQYGHTNSASTRKNVATSLRLNMAMDSVIDDREFLADGTTPNPDYGRPVCRMVRDGIPMLDYAGVPLSDPEDLAALAADCVPLNVFGITPYMSAWESPIGGVVLSPAELQQMQEDALAYSFVDSTSKGGTSLQTLAFTTSGTLWDGLGYGPLTGAFGIEVRENRTNQKGAQGLNTIYERADLNATWGDAESGLQRVSEGYAEFDLPLVSGVEGVNLLSINTGMRYAHYYNKGGVASTGESASQGVFNWKVQTVFEPFDFVRARLTHSRDVRAPTYRDLFRFQESPPDQFSGNNPWRERTGLSTQNQQERWGQVRIGNPDLKNETSDTTTIGLVLSPGGWAQGMRVSVDYYSINVKDAIVVPFTAGDPITTCWEESGNVAAEYLDNGEVDPNNPGVNGLFNEGQQTCRDIIFARNPDGTRNLNDILSYNSARPENGLPIQRRGVDVSVNYTFPLSRAFESLPGTVSLTVRAARALEASGIQVNSSFGNTPENCAARGGYIVQPITGFAESNANCYIPVSMVGQIRSSTFIPGVSASPKWSGNIITNYRVGSLTTSLSARYIGAARFDNTWCDFEQAAAGDCVNMNAEGTQFLNNSVDKNWVDPYFNFSLNGSYELMVPNMKSLEVFGSINNLFDKSPPFTGGGLSGASAQYHDTYGRAYRMGVRMRF